MTKLKVNFSELELHFIDKLLQEELSTAVNNRQAAFDFGDFPEATKYAMIIDKVSVMLNKLENAEDNARHSRISLKKLTKGISNNGK